MRSSVERSAARSQCGQRRDRDEVPGELERSSARWARTRFIAWAETYEKGPAPRLLCAGCEHASSIDGAPAQVPRLSANPSTKDGRRCANPPEGPSARAADDEPRSPRGRRNGNRRRHPIAITRETMLARTQFEIYCAAATAARRRYRGATQMSLGSAEPASTAYTGPAPLQ